MSNDGVCFSASQSRWPVWLVCEHDVLASAHDLFNLSGAPCWRVRDIRRSRVVAVRDVGP